MSEAAAAYQADARLQTILKAVVVGARAQDPASRPGGEDLSTAFTAAGAIEPPYDPEALCLLMEHSNSLRQNVDAYATNIDGFGHRFEPAIDFDADDADERVADTIYLERLATREKGELDAEASLQPTDYEITARRRELQQLARIERARLESFFDFCCFDHSFVDLRRRTRQDLEVTGNAFWEVLRDGRGEIARLVYVPSYSVRLMPLDTAPVEVDDRIRISPVTFEQVSSRRRLRRFVQIQGTERVYFKSRGDPRVLSRTTGRVFDDIEALLDANSDDGPASELVHFAVHSPRSPYGVPRWVGTLLAVLGSRQMEEVNYLYFENKSTEGNTGRFARDARAPIKVHQSKTWTFIVEVSGPDKEVTLAVKNADKLPGNYKFRIRDEATGVEFDPKQQSEYTFIGATARRFSLRTEKIGELASGMVNRLFPAGWSLFSVPMEPEPTDVRAQLGDDLSDIQVFQYFDRELYDPEHEQHVDIQSGIGYWIFLEDETELDFEGLQTNTDDVIEIPLAAGWNLIGNPFENATVEGKDMLIAMDGETIPVDEAVSREWLAQEVYEYNSETGG